ncbi:MAG: tryptophan synthase subunit alpha [Thermoguttaceae bacterium]|nr:tryptophan synthase subunit alpha [Thermoguttaceae bacterium]
MSKIPKAFENGKAFIPFVTCGDPDLETTAEIVRELVKNGAALVELGIPFSDPTAEGPVIQGANLRALSGGVTTDKIFNLVRDLRRETDVPMVFMTYANVVFSYGPERFLAACRDVGIDGLIASDMPDLMTHIVTLDIDHLNGILGHLVMLLFPVAQLLHA